MEPASNPDNGLNPFRLGFVPGVNPSKWVRVWSQRRPEPLQLVPVDVLDDGHILRSGQVDAALVRLPVDRTDLHVIPLYDELPVVVMPREHELTILDQVEASDLAGQTLLNPLDNTLTWELPATPAKERPQTTSDAVALVAAGIGVLVTPMSVARLHARRDLTYRELVDGPTSAIGLAWVQDRHTDLVEEFIGIVRGRTVNSSRGTNPAKPRQAPKPDPEPRHRPKPGNKHGTRTRTARKGRGKGPRR